MSKQKKYSDLISDIHVRISNGASQEEIISFIHHEGENILDAIKLIREVYEVNLSEAKEAVSSHADWQNINKANKPLHDELESYMRPKH